MNQFNYEYVGTSLDTEMLIFIYAKDAFEFERTLGDIRKLPEANSRFVSKKPYDWKEKGL